MNSILCFPRHTKPERSEHPVRVQHQANRAALALALAAATSIKDVDTTTQRLFALLPQLKGCLSNRDVQQAVEREFETKLKDGVKIFQRESTLFFNISIAFKQDADNIDHRDFLVTHFQYISSCRTGLPLDVNNKY